MAEAKAPAKSHGFRKVYVVTLGIGTILTMIVVAAFAQANVTNVIPVAITAVLGIVGGYLGANGWVNHVYAKAGEGKAPAGQSSTGDVPSVKPGTASPPGKNAPAPKADDNHGD